MGQQMSQAILRAESMDVLDIAADLLQVPATRFNTVCGKVPMEEVAVSGAELQRRRDFVRTLSHLYVPEIKGELDENSGMAFPVSLATLFYLDSDMDGRFHGRDVEKVIRSWRKAYASGKKEYTQWPQWKRDLLHQAVSDLSVAAMSEIVTQYTVRNILIRANSKSIWEAGVGLRADDPLPATPPAPVPTEIRQLATSTLAAGHLLQEHSTKMAASIADNSKRFCQWLWNVLTVRPHGQQLETVTEKELSALAFICYEDTVDIELLLFPQQENTCGAFPPRHNVEAVEATSRSIVELYSKSGKRALTKEEFQVAADIIARLYEHRGEDLSPVGRYELKSGIGSGANGLVRLGRDVCSSKRVAIKTFNRHDPGEEYTREVCMGNNMEIERVLQIYESVLPHRHITALKDVIVTDRRIHFVYSFCGGGAMFDLLTHRRADVSEEESATTSPSPSPRCSLDDGKRNGSARRCSSDRLSKMRDGLRVMTTWTRPGPLGYAACGDMERENVDLSSSNLGPLASEAEARMIILSLAQAVDHLHAKRICHRDIRLRNLLYNGVLDAVQLSDFDTAVEVAPGWDLMDGEAVVGSLYYLSPEQVAKHAYSGFAADMWSVGVCLYWLLKGRPPFVGESSEQVLDAIRAHEWEPLLLLSDEVNDLLQRLLNPVPEQRPTAAELLEHPWLQGDSAPEVSLAQVMRTYEFESHAELSGKRHLTLASKLIESILSDAGAHHITEYGDKQWVFRCTLPEHDIKFSIVVRVKDKHGLLAFHLVRGQGLVFVKASRKIARVWCRRLQGLITRLPRRDSMELEHALDLDMSAIRRRGGGISSRLRCSLALPPYLFKNKQVS